MAKKTGNTVGTVPREDIARCAYEIWEREGRPEGRHAEHWQQAEMTLQSRRFGTEDHEPRSRKPQPPRAQAAAHREKHFEVLS